MKTMHVIVDLQFGSCGKGLFAGYLAAKNNPDTIVTAWGPNAGHTLVDSDGEKYVTIALPSGMFTSRNLKRIMIGPGSVINPEILIAEMERYAHWLPQLHIHPHAMVVQERHRELEAEYGAAIGSTMKGVGEATIEKIRRKRTIDDTKQVPEFTCVAMDALCGTPLENFVANDLSDWNDLLDRADVVQVEGAQGFSLSINQGLYPYTTSRDCTTMQTLSDCGIPFGTRSWRANMLVYGVCRTYPIRVANRFRDGVQIGTSGPCYPDQREIEWADIGVEPELTTVTKLPRRIFTFSKEQIRQAVRMNGVDKIFLNFVNYPPYRDSDGRATAELIAIIESVGGSVQWLGYGPKITDVKEWNHD